MLLSVTPEILLPPVWPDPLSLATTRGISVDVFSSPYLDVSVQAVPLPYLFDSVWDTFRWVSPFGNLRITAHLQLPEAYRSLSRPSSAPDAKAFSMCSSSLDLVTARLFAHLLTQISHFPAAAPLPKKYRHRLHFLGALLTSFPFLRVFGFRCPAK